MRPLCNHYEIAEECYLCSLSERGNIYYDALKKISAACNPPRQGDLLEFMREIDLIVEEALNK